MINQMEPPYGVKGCATRPPGVKGCVNTHDGVGCSNSFKAYGVVEGTCGVCVVGLVRSLCWCSHHTFTVVGGVK